MSGITSTFDTSPLLNDLYRMAEPSLVNDTATWVGGYMVREIRKHFDHSTLWDDSPMPPSKDGGIDKSTQLDDSPMTPSKNGGKTLVKSQALQNSYGNYEVSGGTVTLGSDSPYASYHHDGTDPYVIQPKSKLALHFMAGGEMRFAKKINHPGLVPRPVLGVNPRNEQMIIKYITTKLLGG